MTFRSTIFLLLAAGGHLGGFAQGEEDEFPVLVRTFSEVKSPAPPFENGNFVPRKGETIAFIGGTNTFDQQRFGYLEERFHLAWPERELKIRNLGWQGDTVYYQARPRFFYTRKGDPQPGSSVDTRERTPPEIIFVHFGKVESLEGLESLPRFLDAYGGLLEQLGTRTGRLVLVAPAPFFRAGPAAALTESRNKVLGRFVDGIRNLAEDRALLFADAFSPMFDSPDKDLSGNGIHLSESGHRRFAEVLAEQLEFPSPEEPAENSVALDSLRESIRRKNRLWHQYYHPTNWAFLFGDRQHVPASRDHEDTRKRWFLEEIGALPSLVAETETDIFRYAREAVKASSNR